MGSSDCYEGYGAILDQSNGCTRSLEEENIMKNE